MNLDLFKIKGLEVIEVLDELTGYQNLLFKCQADNYYTVLKWEYMGFTNELYWPSISERLRTLLYNRVKFDDKYYQSEGELSEFIKANTPNYTPQEKLDLVLEYLSSITDFDGQKRDFIYSTEIQLNEIWRRFYFVNAYEFVFYLNNLLEQELVKCESRENASYYGLHLTLKGLTRIASIFESKNSKLCFVAMSFDDSLVYIFKEAIEPALIETGFSPYIVNNVHVDSDKTINDAILAGIKQSHFTIADFTQHKAGVYFEAGYALGRGQKVFYTCREDEISAAHFDTRNFQHIVWSDAEDLKRKLIDKINVFIKE
jgi:nucleoside 2-deoxyribosyltransferase